VSEFVIRTLGYRPLAEVWAEMKSFTDARGPATADELWFVEHPSIFTLGIKADTSNLIAPGDIEVLQIDRGGDVTYHGPGQLVAYLMLDLRRRGFDIRQLVSALEDAVIATLAPHGVAAYGRRDAPGVYIDGRKLAALGLRVRRGCTFHGLAVNVAMDLEPFGRINPCGFAGLGMTQIADHAPFATIDAYRPILESALVERVLAGANGRELASKAS
jgi:lipoyl(octanoyl) transferase